jgi:hypothetical protein
VQESISDAIGAVIECAAVPDTLTLRGEDSGMRPKTQPLAPCRRSPIDPVLKSWIDNVIVPALVDEWNRSQDTMRAA